MPGGTAAMDWLLPDNPMPWPAMGGLGLLLLIIGLPAVFRQRKAWRFLAEPPCTRTGSCRYDHFAADQ